MDSDEKSVTIKYRDTQARAAKLRAAAEEKGVSMSDFVRMAVHKAVATTGPQMTPKWATTGPQVHPSPPSPPPAPPPLTPTSQKPRKPLVPPDPRHSAFREYYKMAYREHRGMPEDGTVAWGPADAGQLNNLLKANPTVPIEALKRWFLNWWKSDVNRSAMPHTWLMKLPNYREGALDRFGKPMVDEWGIRVGSAQ